MNKQQRDALMLIIAGGFFVVLLCLMFFPVPSGNRDLLLMMLGALTGAFSVLVGIKPPTPTDSKP